MKNEIPQSFDKAFAFYENREIDVGNPCIRPWFLMVFALEYMHAENHYYDINIDFGERESFERILMTLYQDGIARIYVEFFGAECSESLEHLYHETEKTSKNI